MLLARFFVLCFFVFVGWRLRSFVRLRCARAAVSSSPTRLPRATRGSTRSRRMACSSSTSRTSPPSSPTRRSADAVHDDARRSRRAARLGSARLVMLSRPAPRRDVRPPPRRRRQRQCGELARDRGRTTTESASPMATARRRAPADEGGFEARRREGCARGGKGGVFPGGGVGRGRCAHGRQGGWRLELRCTRVRGECAARWSVRACARVWKGLEERSSCLLHRAKCMAAEFDCFRFVELGDREVACAELFTKNWLLLYLYQLFLSSW